MMFDDPIRPPAGDKRGPTAEQDVSRLAHDVAVVSSECWMAMVTVRARRVS